MRIIFYQRRLANGEPERPEVPACLRDAGHDVRETDDEPGQDWSAAEVVWLQGNAAWYPAACRRLERSPPAGRPRVIVWHTEPLPPPPGSGLPRPWLHLREIAKIVLRDRRATDPYTNAARLRRLARFDLPHVLAVSARVRQAYLAARGVPSHFVPLGYYPPAHGRDLGFDRDIDVLFLGTMQVPRRRRLAAALRAAGVPLRCEGSWHDSAAWGEARTQLLNRTRILLNLPRHPGDFAGLRMILGMCNGALIISEPIAMSDPYVPGRHFVSAPAEQLPAVIRHYLDHPDQRQRIVDEARRLVTQDLSMARSVQQIVNLADDTGMGRADNGAGAPVPRRDD